MKKKSSADGLDSRIVDEAAEWFVEFNTGEVNAATRRKFDAWLKQSAEHVRAYLEMIPLWEDTGHVDRSHTLAADELIQLARQQAHVIPLGVGGHLPIESLPHKTNRWALVAFCICAVIGTTAVLWSFRSTYTTDVGMQRVVVLEDGSTVELNTRSRVKVHYSKTARTIDLVSGEALFRVEKDANRPFIVRTDSTDVRAVGTQFDVYRRKDGTTVTVLEGRVAVSSNDSSSPGADPLGTVVSAGEQVTATPLKVSNAAQTDVSRATAWQQHRLIFSATPLLEVAAEFNRYNERQLIVRDPQLASFLVNGIFSSSDPASLIRFLRAQPDLNVEDRGSQIIITQK